MVGVPHRFQGRFRRQALLLDSLGAHVLGGDHADPQSVWDIAEDHGRGTTDEYHVVPSGHLEDGRLDIGH